MKTIMTVALMIIATASYAKTSSTIYCMHGGHYINSKSERGHFECQEDISNGKVCFVGNRQELVNLINKKETFHWDEEWLDNAWFVGLDNIGYDYVDGPNNHHKRITIKRCFY